jgi:predicted MFS family arabinose efflux permease
MPIDLINSFLGWRGTFLVLAGFSATVAFSIFALVPGLPSAVERLHWRDALSGFGDTVCDWRFLRIAPLSASVVGAAFAIHGLWAARWLTDINGLQSAEVLRCLLAMGVGLTIGALLIGIAAVWLRGIGVSENKIFSGLCIAFIVLQLVLQSNAALPPALLWGMIGGFGGMTVLSYSILDGMFDPAVVGRANSALNVLHLGSAWVIQAGMGLIVARWPPGQSGHYPIVAYRSAFALPLVMQISGLIWFLVAARIGCFEKTAVPVCPATPGCGG